MTCRRPAVVLLLATGAAWLLSFFVQITWYGRAISARFGCAYVALSWDRDEEKRNTWLLSGFDYPHFPGRGAGLGWTPDRGRLAIHRPPRGEIRRLGLWLPHFAWRGRYPGAGLPLWIPLVAASAPLAIGAARRRHRARRGRCMRCGYAIAGLPHCPECGGAQPRAPSPAAEAAP